MANSDLVASVSKAIALVKIVGASQDGLRMSELAEAANMKTVTCFNLVRTLLAGGFLEKINGRLYVGNEITRLSANRFQTDFFRNAEDALLKLNQIFSNCTLIFAIPGRNGMEQTHRISHEHPGVIQRLNNEMLPPYASAAGLLGLAYIQDGDVLLRIEEKYPFSEFGVNLWKSRKALNAFLEKCRSDKIAVMPFDTDVFLRVSVPVFDKSGKFIAVIGASCPARDYNEKSFLAVQQELKRSADLLKR